MTKLQVTRTERSGAQLRHTGKVVLKVESGHANFEYTYPFQDQPDPNEVVKSAFAKFQSDIAKITQVSSLLFDKPMSGL